MKLPSEVLIEDEALRDGLQNEKRIFSLEEKLRLIDQLVAAGLQANPSGLVRPSQAGSADGQYRRAFRGAETGRRA